MRPQILASILVASTMALIAFTQPSMGVDPEVRANGTLYFTNEILDQNNQGLVCGEKTNYALNATPPEAGKAYVGRSLVIEGCDTDWDFNVPQEFTITGDVEVFFPLGCDMIGVIDDGTLDVSLEVTLLKNNGEVLSETHNVDNLICQANHPYEVGVIMTGIEDMGTYLVDDILTFRLVIFALNTEDNILRWFHMRVGAANVTAPGLFEPEPTKTTGPTAEPTGGTTEPTSETTEPTETSTSPPEPGSAPPECNRQSPEEENIQRDVGEEFTLSAECTDTDDDLSHCDWTVDGAFEGNSTLGPSPSAAEHTFSFDEEGDHLIACEPQDQAGNAGPPATWNVHVGEGPPPSPSPTETTPIPFFPTATALSLATAAGLGGALIVLRRRP